MVRLALTRAAYEAIGGDGQPAPDARWDVSGAEYAVWVTPQLAEQLRAVRLPGESTSDTILRLAAQV